MAVNVLILIHNYWSRNTICITNKAYITMIINVFQYTACAEYKLKFPYWHFIAFNFILIITGVLISP